MRILVHDFAGHPFQVQLSRELARHGHSVMHAYPLGLPGPKGRLGESDQDPVGFSIHAIPLSSTFQKYSPAKRFFAHRKYARDLANLISSMRPDVVLSGNTPIDVQGELMWWCHRNGIGFVHWVQDIYCRAIDFFLRKRIGKLAVLFSFPFTQLEKALARYSEATIVIAPAFRELLSKWGIDDTKMVVFENWAPLDEVANLPRDNAWSDAHGLKDKTVFLYSGTMGMKHRPELLYQLAENVGSDCKVVVVSEGIGREYLKTLPARENLLLLDFQPYDQLPNVLSSADVLVATLESEAGSFAVPSKILTYLCAGRPILLSAPKMNLAAEVIRRSGAGFVAEPTSSKEWVQAAQTLAVDATLRKNLGAKARSYAETAFDITKIAGFFETILLRACRKDGEPSPAVETEAAKTRAALQ